MTHPIVRLAAGLFVAACASGAGAESLLFSNGNVYTGVATAPKAQAILVADGRIARVGTTAEVEAAAPRDVRRIDLRGLTVLPGLTDSHAHLADIGWREIRFDVTGVASLRELQDRLRARAAADASPWITGSGWIESRWTPAEFPTRADLDAAVSGRPVMLGRADGHAIVVNSRALAAAGIGRETPDPPGGQILRDPATGEPTGMLIDNAMGLVESLVPPPSAEERSRALEVGAARSVRLGWTELQIAGTTIADVESLCRLYREGRIELRLYVALQGPGADADRLLREGRRWDDCDARLTVRGIKLYVDGALGSRGAALLAPYSDAPGQTGLLLNQREDLLRVMVEALRSGIQVETHAIGDRGNRLILDLYEEAFATVPVAKRTVAEPRFRIEHAQFVDDADLPRFARLGVIASMQTSHAISDMFFAPQRLGPARIRGAYAWRRLLDAGAIIAGGSDAPVEQGDPRVEFYAAVARRSLEGFAGPDWGLDQRLTREEALAILTRSPAWAAFEEAERGTIEAGRHADLSVFADDLMTMPESEIPKARAVMTVIGGRIAHDARVAAAPRD